MECHWEGELLLGKGRRKLDLAQKNGTYKLQKPSQGQQEISCKRNAKDNKACQYSM